VRAPRCRLYLVTPPAFEPAAFAGLLARALDSGDVACLQIKLANANADEVGRAVDALRPVAHAHNLALLLNGPAALARATGCDGVHLNEQDGYDEARRVLGGKAILGVACHTSRHEAMVAAEAGADYVVFGPFFGEPARSATPDLIAWWAELMEVPVVATGGVTVENCAALVEAGADFIAVSTAVWNHAEGPAVAVRAFHRALHG